MQENPVFDTLPLLVALPATVAGAVGMAELAYGWGMRLYPLVHGRVLVALPADWSLAGQSSGGAWHAVKDGSGRVRATLEYGPDGRSMLRVVPRFELQVSVQGRACVRDNERGGEVVMQNAEPGGPQPTTAALERALRHRFPLHDHPLAYWQDVALRLAQLDAQREVAKREACYA